MTPLFFQNIPTGVGLPALVVDEEKRTSVEDPEEKRGLPGFGLENVLGRNKWLVYPYGLLTNILPYLTGTTLDIVSEELEYLWNARVNIKQYRIIESLHNQVITDEPLRHTLSNLMKKDINLQLLQESIKLVERRYWALVSTMLADRKTAVEALQRYYLHGYT